jgi:putative ABC transport system ATP-binding protein
MIRLDRVSKTYRQGRESVRALDDVSLEIGAGEFVAVMGPSGSGKSTMLHLMGGLDVPTAGEVVVDGRALAHLRDDEITIFRRRRIGVVFQFFNLLPTLTAEENVALPLLYDGHRLAQVRDRVGAALEAVGVAARRRHRPDELSGGEMQRVAIARALVTDPALLLADEPTGNLDSATGAEVLRLVRAANEERGLTVVLVTHDPRAAAHAGRAVTLVDGRIASAA